VNGTQGGESEALLGRWRASRGIGDEIVIATKVGGRPIASGGGFDAPREGLSCAAIREGSEGSRERLGVERIDLYYAHIPDQTGVPLDDQVAAFGELVADGMVGLLGVSNHWAWQVALAGGPCSRFGSARGRRAAVSPHLSVDLADVDLPVQVLQLVLHRGLGLAADLAPDQPAGAVVADGDLAAPPAGARRRAAQRRQGAEAPVVQVLATMRAMRRLKPDPVPRETLERLVEA
jgi:aryl-alcohol dehydrogenase-like predicted oxidoreductase